MEEVVLPQDNLKNIISFMNPRELNEFLSKNEFMMFLLDDPSVLYNLSRDYFVPYCKDITLDEMCNFYNMSKIDLMMEAVKMGDLRIIEYLIQPHIKEKYNIDTGSYDIAFYRAAELGYKNIVQLFLDSDVISDPKSFIEDINEYVMCSAAGAGHKDVVQMMLDLGVNQYGNSLISAASNCHKNVVSLLVSKIKNDKQLTSDYIINIYNEAMISASSEGHIEMVEMMLNLGANSYNETMGEAALYGSKEIVQMMLDLGANDYVDAIEFAYDACCYEIVELIEKYMEDHL